MLSRFPRRTDAALFLAMALAAATLVVVVTADSLRAVGRTFAGFVVWDDLVVVALGRPEWTGIAAKVPFRSVVTTVDGQQVTNRAELQAVVAAAPPGTIHAYGFRDRDGLQRRSIASMRFGRGDWLATLGIYLWNGVVFLLTGLAVFYLKPELPQSRAVLAFGFVWGMTLVLAVDLFTVGRFDHLYFVFEALSIAAGVHLALRFPENRLPGARPLIAVYLQAFVIGVLQSVLFLRWPDALLSLNDVVYLALAATCIGALATVAIGALRGETPLVQRRARVVLAGWVVAFVVPLVPMLAFFLFGQPISFSLLALTGFVYPLSLGYAVIRHDLFEADRFVKLSIVYAALTAIVSLAYVGIVFAADRLALGFAVHDNAIFPVAFVLVALVTIAPLRERVQRAIDRLFYRGRIDYKSTVAGLSERLAPLLETRAIVDQVVVTLRYVLGVDHVAVWERVDRSLVRRDAAGSSTIPVTDPTVVTLEATGRIVSRDEIEESPSLRHGRAALQALFDTLEAVLVAPLGRPGLLTGLLAIGPKISGRPLSADDLDVLRTVANATTSALETARAVAQLQSTRERLQEAEHLAAVGELSAAVAHGIRNPLAGIRIAAQLGREQTGDTTAVRESLDDVLGGVDRLEAQVRGILDFARPFEPTLARMDVGAWLQDVASQIAGQCTERGVTVAVHADGPRPIRGDVAHLTQVLHELVRNALEAMPLGGTITLAAGPCDGDASRVRIVVEDTGSGVPADQQERIFQLFATTKARGTGVGLAVARKIVERHGGSLRLETAAPMAARFAIELPVA